MLVKANTSIIFERRNTRLILPCLQKDTFAHLVRLFKHNIAPIVKRGTLMFQKLLKDISYLSVNKIWSVSNIVLGVTSFNKYKYVITFYDSQLNADIFTILKSKSKHFWTWGVQSKVV